MNSMTTTAPWLMYTLFLLLGLLTGYAIGRRTGHQEGVVEGLAFAPLDLQRTSLERGQCILCGTKSDIVVNSTGEWPTDSQTELTEVDEQAKQAPHDLNAHGAAGE